MKRQRWTLLAAGAVLSGVIVIAVALLLPPTQAPRERLSVWRPYFLIPVEFLCGKNVVWVNPDGSRVHVGKTSDLGMPRPRPVQGRP